MRRLPPRRPVGSPKTPGSGRRKGSLNRKTVELRQLMGALVGDLDYQSRLRTDFRRRRVHPTIEALVWGHVVGKPTDRVQLSADVAVTQNLEKERELFSRLSLQQMEELAAESQALVDKAMAMVRANSVRTVPATAGGPPTATTHTPDQKDTGDATMPSSDRDRPLNGEGAEMTARPAGEPTPLAAAVLVVATGESAERPPGSAEG